MSGAVKIAVVYLLRDQDGVKPFFDSYTRHPAGCPHDLVILAKGCRAILPAEYCEYPKHRELFHIWDVGRDLDAYRYAALHLHGYEWLMFFNSRTVIKADKWLRTMLSVPADADLVGSSWSYESFYSNRPVLWRRLFFPPYPNFHIRTNAFLIRRETMLRIWPRINWFKWLNYLFESGWHSMTRRVRCWHLVEQELFADNKTCNNPRIVTHETCLYPVC